MSEKQENDKVGAVEQEEAPNLSEIVLAEENAAAEAVAEAEEQLADDDEGFDVDLSELNEAAAPLKIVDPTMLLGETRDHILGAIKRTPIWKSLDKKGQTNLASEVEQACKGAIVGCVHVAASMKLDAIEVTISKPTLTDKRQIEAKILCPYEPKTWAAMPEHGKRTLVFADAETLMGARAAEVMEDQHSLFGDETPEAKAKREEIERDAAEYEASVERAKEIKQADLPEAIGGIQTEPRNEVAEAIGTKLRPEIKAATERGRAHAEAGGASTVPKDLEGKPDEVGAWLKGYDAVAHPGGAVQTSEGAKPPRGHRGKRRTTDEIVADRARQVADA